MVDPQTTQNQDQENELFWWSEDIFNNSDIFFDNTKSTDENEIFADNLSKKYNIEDENIINNEPDDSELPYADVLDKNKSYEHEFQEETPTDEIQQETQEYKMDEKYYPKAEVQNIQETKEETKEEPQEDLEEETEEQVEPRDDEQIEEESPQEQKASDIQNKFNELLNLTKKVYESDKSITEEWFEIIWADNDKLNILYQFQLEDSDNPEITINKLETNKESEEENINQLKFFIDQDSASLNIVLNDTLLFDEVEDLQNEPKKKMQIVDKLNKFIFLAQEHLKKIEKEMNEKFKIEQERKKLQDIFRNF